MKEAVMKVIDTLTQEDFHGAFQKLLEQYNKSIAAGGDYFKRDKSFMCVLSIKVPIRKKFGNLFNDPRISVTSCKHDKGVQCASMSSLYTRLNFSLLGEGQLPLCKYVQTDIFRCSFL